MAEIREMGIPFLRRRMGRRQEDVEYNKLVEAVAGLYESRVEKPPLVVRKPSCGFAPIPIYGEENGIGLVPGKLRFLQVPTFYESPSDDNNADEIFPTIDSVSIDSDPPPSVSLVAGDYEAWVIFKEIYNAPEARIEFKALGAGPGTIDRDEKAIRLCSFEVSRNGDQHGVTLLEQNVSCDLAIWTDNHQFRAYKTDDDKIKVEGGNMMFLQGQSNPLVAERTEVADSSIFTITESGSIWLDVTATISRHSTTLVELGLTAVPDIRLTMYRIYDLGTPEFIFRGSSVNAPNPPAHGTNNNDVWTSSLDLHYEICRVELSAGGEVFITDQIADGPIWVTDLVDGALTPETS
tara:strand:- start:594 stop:1643 length:1050 start_codon:yes stop_codon:yes gene_type:complete